MFPLSFSGASVTDMPVNVCTMNLASWFVTANTTHSASIVKNVYPSLTTDPGGGQPLRAPTSVYVSELFLKLVNATLLLETLLFFFFVS